MGKIENITLLPPRDAQSYKNNFGRVLIVAGSMGMSGAAILAGKAALRSGAGLVEILCPDCVWQIVASAEPCYMCSPLADDHNGRICEDAIEFVIDKARAADVVAIGPGLGQSEQLIELVCSLLNCDQLPLIIDADGLNNLAKMTDWYDMVNANLIITPHPGEMQRLCKSITDFEISPDREELAIEFSNATGTVTILKGAGTIVACGDDYYINKTGNPGMATAGSGDVLTGILASILGQIFLSQPQSSSQQTAFKAAITATYLHGLAGDKAAQNLTETAMTAADIIDALPFAFKSAGSSFGESFPV